MQSVHNMFFSKTSTPDQFFKTLISGNFLKLFFNWGRSRQPLFFLIGKGLFQSNIHRSNSIADVRPLNLWKYGLLYSNYALEQATTLILTIDIHLAILCVSLCIHRWRFNCHSYIVTPRHVKVEFIHSFANFTFHYVVLSIKVLTLHVFFSFDHKRN